MIVNPEEGSCQPSGCPGMDSWPSVTLSSNLLSTTSTLDSSSRAYISLSPHTMRASAGQGQIARAIYGHLAVWVIEGNPSQRAGG